MPGKKRFALVAVSVALAVGPVGTAVAAPERPAGPRLDGQITSLTPLDGDDFSENTLLGNPGKEAVNGIACDGIGAVVDTRLRCRP